MCNLSEPAFPQSQPVVWGQGQIAYPQVVKAAGPACTMALPSTKSPVPENAPGGLFMGCHPRHWAVPTGQGTIWGTQCRVEHSSPSLLCSQTSAGDRDGEGSYGAGGDQEAGGDQMTRVGGGQDYRPESSPPQDNPAGPDGPGWRNLFLGYMWYTKEPGILESGDSNRKGTSSRSWRRKPRITHLNNF